MPELPDVEVFRRYFEATALHSRIAEVDVIDPDLLRNGATKELKAAAIGRTFQRGRRHGKFLFGELNDGKAIRFHFGMTGFLHCYEDASEAPAHARVVFTLRNNRKLAYDCQRKFGHVGIVENIDAFLSEKKLGPDALEIDFNEFDSAVLGRKRPVKSNLMDQSRLAGVGNVYSDEILFQARVHPESAPSEWPKPVARKIYKVMHEVLETAIKSEADPARMPKKWLTPHRVSGPCPRCKGELRKKKIAGRTSWFCPACQQRL